MGYTDVGVRVNVDLLGPQYIIPEPKVLQHPIDLCGIYTGCGHALACG